MPSPDGTDLVQVIASEVAKQLPVREALSPAATEVGSLGGDLVKAIRLALAPIQYLAVQQDRFRRFIERSAERVTQDRRVEPAPQLLGPILEGIRYEPEGSISDEAFSELLSRAFDRERAAQAHPAFPGLIRSLSDDEMRLVHAFAHLEPRPYPLGDLPIPRVLSSAIGLTNPENIFLYASHLGSLGLTIQPFGWDPENFVVMIDDVRSYMLSAWGSAFAAAVMAPHNDDVSN